MYIHHDHPSRIPWKPGQSDGSSSHCPRHQFSLACHNTREGLCGGPETGKYTTTFVRPGLVISVTSPYTTHKKWSWLALISIMFHKHGTPWNGLNTSYIYTIPYGELGHGKLFLRRFYRTASQALTKDLLVQVATLGLQTMPKYGIPQLFWPGTLQRHTCLWQYVACIIYFPSPTDQWKKNAFKFAISFHPFQ